MLNKSSVIPLYVQIKEILEKEIVEGILKPGDALPTEKELTVRFSVSRMTLRQALNALIEDGYLVRLKGIGTIVQERKLNQTLTTLRSFTEDIKSRGMTPSTKILSFKKQKGTKDAVEKLGIKLKDDVLVTKRIRFADKHPISLETNYVPQTLLPTLTETVMESSLHQFIKESGLRLVKAKTKIEAAMPSIEEQQHLNITDKDPVLVVERITFLDDGTPIEWSVSVNRADRYTFTAELYDPSV
ncbi:GntR family transcriptional regulator [Halalkalibacter alkaliphilus]|uniref:GntR family transcriptional regulator n=1 Tax=Halalkalibacter alkaliphilus TaxID=2917993 RepID=A0A9X1ZYS3_9BACI|nr:GntR family transcriptional regulator [Halalkalibacter alkaliphilus]MCL7746856.1 GntR family transcriptional regulator [Halalkalibacter alkaliphilus]